MKGINNLQAEYEQQYGPGNYVPPVALHLLDLPRHGRRRFPDGLRSPSSGSTWCCATRSAHPPGSCACCRLRIALPYLANTTGWLMTEWGRQPWIVFGLMKTADAVSPNVSPAAWCWLSLVGFTLVYGALMVADIYLLAKYAAGEAAPRKPRVRRPVASPLAGAGGARWISTRSGLS